MLRIRRAQFVFFSLEEQTSIDISALLSGRIARTKASQVVAHSLLTRSKHPLTEDELRFLLTLPLNSWHPAETSSADLQSLNARGLILTDGDDSVAVEMRRRNEALASQAWHPYAAHFHFFGRAEEPTERIVDVKALAASAPADAKAFVERHGPAPPAFYRRRPETDGITLPLIEKSGGLYDVLLRRQTTRAFDPSRLMSLESLTILMRYVFGCHGYAPLAEGFTALHKTSPSGGSLHPIEAYPLVLRVEDLTPGFYHYDVENHALEPLIELSLQDAKKLAVEISSGQAYAGTAHVLVVMTARFFRNFWKYRHRSRTYAVLLMDAAHLSQTFYLVAAELGLGAFFSAAINSPRIEEVLELQALEEGPLGICGCGVPTTDRSSFGLAYRPFTPGDAKK